MRLADVLQLPEAQALLRFQQENPTDRSARLIFTDYLRDQQLDEIADCVSRSLELSGAVLLPDGSRYVYDGWVQTPSFEIAQGVWVEFCWIPAGRALLGSPESEKMRGIDEREHTYETAGFWLGKYPVTQEQWQGVMGNNPSHFKGARLPVETVSWEDCQKFIKKCKVAGFKLKRPQEDEWEYACRGGLGNKQAFYWGETLNGDKANCDGNYPYGTTTLGAYLEETTEVGSYEKVAPQPWGLCDMSGNVWEWRDNLYTSEGSGRVFRGGCWNFLSRDCRSADRGRIDPAYSDDNLGLRLALVPLAETDIHKNK